MSHKMFLPVFIFTFAASLLPAVSVTGQNQNQNQAPDQNQGQSLADVARKQREKKQQQQPVQPQKSAPKVYTNEDIASGHSSTPSASPTATAKAAEEAQSHGTEKRPATEWSAMIRAQKQLVNTMQAQAERLKASIHYVVAGEYSNGVQYNEFQKRKQDTLDRLEQQLAQERTKLEQMQDTCRKQGYGSNVCDPS